MGELTECTEVERGTVQHVFGGRRVFRGDKVSCQCGQVDVEVEVGTWLRIKTHVFAGAS